MAKVRECRMIEECDKKKEKRMRTTKERRGG